MNELQKQFSAMVAGLVKPGADIIAALTPEKAHLWHMATGLVGEVAELCEAFDKGDRSNFLEEAGDGLFYAEGTLQVIGTTVHMIESGADENCVFSDAIVAAGGEVLDAIKRHVIYGKQLDVIRVKDNMAKFVRALDWELDCFEYTRGDALAHNFDKLGKRYQGHKYTDAQAVARADKAGEEGK